MKGTYVRIISVVLIDGTWSFPKDFTDAARSEAEKLDIYSMRWM